MAYVGEVITGPEGGYIACVSNEKEAFEIHPMGENKNREFYSHKAAQDLATGHAEHLNRGMLPYSSFIRRL